MDDRLFKAAMGKFTTGVTVLTTELEGTVHGMTANAFMSVSLEPKLILISVAKTASMHEYMQEGDRFAISVLGNGQEAVSRYFARQTEEDAEVSFERFEDRPVIEGAITQLACTKYNEVDAGDHTLFIGSVENVTVQDEAPLVYFEGKYRYME